jgi:hypothetical protein
LGVPLTTKVKENKYYHRVNFKGNEQCVMLSQMKIFEGKRMRSKKGELPHPQFDEIRRNLADVVLGDF